MSDPLRVLMLEDTPSDAELAEHELRNAGIVFTAQRVQTRDAFIHALNEFHPDIVLSDYNLPEFDGMSALELVRRDYPDVPVVMVTGALPDIKAVELIRAGAKDYVLKDRLARLAPAVQRVLLAVQAEHALQLADKSLRESEAKFRALVESTSDWIWEVDERGVYTYASPQVFDMLGYTVDEIIGKTPFDLMMPDAAAKIRAKFNIVAEEKKPFSLFETVNLHKYGRVVFLETSGSPIIDARGVLKGYRGIDRDITERKEAEKERRASAEKLEHILMQTIEVIASTVEARDPYTAGHQRRVAALASAIAREMGLSDHDVRGLYLAACIHDLGKVRVPAEILSKPGALNAIEYEMIKTHSQIGYDIIKDTQFPWPIAQMVLQHHERIDGSGYPQGLKGEQMLPESRILAVADVVEAISSHRPYRASLGVDVALNEITRNRGVLYDPVVVDKCIELFRDNLFDLDFK